jgi:hypothetical protein
MRSLCNKHKGVEQETPSIDIKKYLDFHARNSLSQIAFLPIIINSFQQPSVLIKLSPISTKSHLLLVTTLNHSWALADYSTIGASGLGDDDDGKNDGLKWKLAESVRKRNKIFTASPLLSFFSPLAD